MPIKERKEVFIPIETPSVNAGMIVRTVVFLVAIINSIAAQFGVADGFTVDQELLYQVISGLFLVGTGAVAWFKNNDVTKKARVRAVVAKQVAKDEARRVK